MGEIKWEVDGGGEAGKALERFWRCVMASSRNKS